MTESLDKPIRVRHGTPDARLLAEIAMASGFTSYEGGGISYNIPYAKRVTPKIHPRLAVLRPSDGSVRRERHSHQP